MTLRSVRESRRRDDRGSVAIEAALGVPAFGLFVVLIIMGGRVELARQAVESSAYEAARAASIERTQQEASQAGTSAARTSLDNQGVQCVSSHINVNTAAFGASLGTTGQVTATVTCDVKLSDLGIPGTPTRTLTATASSPIDAYRARR